MPKAVMLSIRPRYCELIAGNFKSIEVRKTRPKIETPFKCYIYETQGKTDTPWMDEDGHMVFRGRGAVIGEFVCDRMERFDVPFPAYMDQVDTRLLKAACLSYREAHTYLGHRSGYGWHISDLVIYDEPKKLSEFRADKDCHRGNDREDCAGCWDCEISRPPESWRYVEELP